MYSSTQPTFFKEQEVISQVLFLVLVNKSSDEPILGPLSNKVSL